MKTEGIESVPHHGLKVSTDAYSRLKAFHGGGVYWDRQDLIRETLGQILPPVQQVEEGGKRFGIFQNIVSGKDTLWKSKPVSGASVPPEEIKRLNTALEAFKRKAEAPGVQTEARDIIQQFRLPDISKDPELYRLCGPWWDRKLQVLWGCERIPDSSLAPMAAVDKLPIDKAYGLKRILSLLALLLLLCALLAAIFWGWPALKNWYAHKYNQPPTAAIRLDSVDENNRIATISDNGSRDPDGTLKSWRVAWGDGREDQFIQPPLKTAHTYDSERDYTISLWCVDNYGATSMPPASTNISFYLLKRQKAAAQVRLEAQQEADQIKAAALAEAAKLKEEAQKQKDLAAQQAQQAKEAQALAKKKMAEAEQAQQKAQAELAAAEQAKTNLPPVAQPPAPQPPQPPKPEPAPPSNAGSEPQADKPMHADPAVKGATQLISQNLEIIKGGAGRPLSGNTIEAILVVRDSAHANASVDVIEWVVDGKAYHTGNAQFTTSLTVAEHDVSVKTTHLGILSTAKAKVVVTGAQTQATDPSYKVVPVQ